MPTSPAYEVVVNIKGAGRNVSPDTYTREKAEEEVAAIRQVQQAADGWLDLPWVSTSGANVIAAFVQRADQPRPAEEGLEDVTPEELLRRLVTTIERMGLRVVRQDGSPWDAPEPEEK